MSCRCHLLLAIVCWTLFISAESSYIREATSNNTIHIPIVSIANQGSCPLPSEEKENALTEINDQVRPILSDLVTSGQVQPTEQSTTDPLYTCNGTPGWRQVVFINMTDASYNCPDGLQEVPYSMTKRTCGRYHVGIYSCSSAFFPVEDGEYSQVCGRLIGYQVGDTYGFHHQDLDIDEAYLDGVSLTYGPVGQRQYIWSFASGIHEGPTGGNHYFSDPDNQCPCDTSDESGNPPPFVGNDYFCESGLHEPFDYYEHHGLIEDDSLWDGHNCLTSSNCCNFNNPPWFSKNLPNPTTDDIELRLCVFFTDVPLELIELYVQ